MSRPVPDTRARRRDLARPLRVRTGYRPRRPVVAAATIALIATLAAGREEGVERWSRMHGSDACRHGKIEMLERASELAFDEGTGRDPRNYPPDRLVDYLHMKLQMRFEDLDDPRFTATEFLTFEPIGAPLRLLTLDAVGLQVDAARLDGRPVGSYQDDRTLTVTFDPPLDPGTEHELSIEYRCEQPWEGIFFTPQAADPSSYTAEVHTQGQTEFNRHWFAAHDSPNERLTTELIVNVPAGFKVSSNGRLVATLESGDRANWHYLQDEPHVSYLVSLVIGRFDVVPLPHPRVPMAVWVPEGLGDRVLQTYGRTGAMLDLLEQRFGMPYPWDRYDQLVVKNFNAGGMENTAATTMYPTAILDEQALLDGDLDGLIAHELAHQWVGDLITCKSWEHLWLNEGWATFASALWFEQRDGRDAYLDAIRRSFAVAERDRTTNDVPMVSPVYDSPEEVFGRRANPYSKGASVLHMLRVMLGEELFWKGTQRYMDRFSNDVVETSDFRMVMEEVSGRSLEWFFDQWCERPGCPELGVAVRYEPDDRTLHVDVDQKQAIDARTPAMRFTLPVHVRTPAGWTVHEIGVDERSTSFMTTLDDAPDVVAIDPELHVLKTIQVDKPQHMWLAQVEYGPTIAARHQAIEALGRGDTDQVVTLLAAIVGDAREAVSIRRTALGSLRGFGSDAAETALLELLSSSVAEARVRVAVTEAAKDLDRDAVLDVLARRAGEDESYATRVAAIEGLAHHDAREHADLIAELVHFPSQHEQVRRAALRALAALDDPRGLELAMQYAAYGHLDRVRPDAIEVVAELAEHDRDRAIELLVDLLDDPEQRARRAAVRALGRFDEADDRVRDALGKVARSHVDPGLRELAERTLGED